jgi:hypothetical protein
MKAEERRGNYLQKDLLDLEEEMEKQGRDYEMKISIKNAEHAEHSKWLRDQIDASKAETKACQKQLDYKTKLLEEL